MTEIGPRPRLGAFEEVRQADLRATTLEGS